MEEIQPRQQRGLNPKHSSELNKAEGTPTERYDQLRKEYRGDPLAQMEIDTFDPSSRLYSLIEDHRAAAKTASESGNWSQEQRLFRKIKQYRTKTYGIGNENT